MTENILNPHDARLEEVVLGACLAESTAIALVADKLRAEMFYEDNNREIYSALLALHHTGRPIDIITVKNELAARGKLDAVGGPFRITALSGGVASSAHLEYHAFLLREKCVRRELIVGLHRRLAAAADETVDVDVCQSLKLSSPFV